MWYLSVCLDFIAQSKSQKKAKPDISGVENRPERVPNRLIRELQTYSEPVIGLAHIFAFFLFLWLPPFHITLISTLTAVFKNLSENSN